MASILMLSPSAPARAHRPHRHGGAGLHHGWYTAALVPSYRTVRVERSTSINRTTRPERKLMALAYIRKKGYLSVSDYRGFTGLDGKFAEAELDSFTLDKKDPLVRTTRGKETVYKLSDE